MVTRTHHRSWGAELATALALGAGEHAQEVFIDPAQGVPDLMFGSAQAHGADEVHRFPQAALIKGRAGIALGQDALEPGVFLFDLGHGVVDALADVRLLGGGLYHMPASGRGHPEHAFRRVFVAVFWVGAVAARKAFRMDFRTRLGEAVRDVLQEDEAQHHILVVGGDPELGFQALAGGFPVFYLAGPCGMLSSSLSCCYAVE